MPARDPNPRDGADYGWLYGPDDDATQVVGASASSPPPGHGAYAAGPPQSPPSDLPPMQYPDARPPARDGRGHDGGGRGSRGGGNRWLRPRRIITLLLVAWLVFLIAVPFWAWGKIEKVDASPSGERPADQPGTTYLLVGSDSREGLTKAQRKQLATGDAEGRRTDTIMMMHVGSGPTTLVSIPRDSIVPIPGHGRTKINAAYAYGGPKLLVETLENVTGVRIDDYVEIGFGGFVNMVDAVGGVEICPKKRIKDKDAGLNLKKGCQEVDGAQALGYARSRHTYATQDLQRVQSQREVLGAIAGEVKSPSTFLNPFRYAGVVTAATDSLRIGDNVGPLSLGRFAWNLSGAMGGSGHNCTVPIADASVRWDKERALTLFGYIKDGQTDKITKAVCTKDGLPAS
ncbi:LCP family protein [Mumia zhuanghuii]|uniref:LytR family transcriptional regulator n=1 Tax=Mumia zhuanghuii TaxID=2585211 RepID=A0A5C4MAT5_9ACTN|nr:LCP family protein [Mumia zhuanghuii]TNC31219.1 LytR family transcriptional regulator [Mumia zhuanghuii]TNC44920.1 LytR family transcriptional regulator [Mumia zhuanghuii]